MIRNSDHSAVSKEQQPLPTPGVLALEIVEDLQAALEQFRLIAEDLGEELEE